jgi:hypothetical protein
MINGDISIDLTRLDEAVSFDFIQSGFTEGTVRIIVGDSAVNITFDEDQYERFQRLIASCEIADLTR